MSLPLEKKIQLKHFEQSEASCGPASLRILLSHFQKNLTEEELKKLCGTTLENGTEHENMIKAVQTLGGQVLAKEDGTVADLEHFTKEVGLPVIVGWFDGDGDHYSVVVAVTENDIVMVDPAVNLPERRVSRALFPKIWFDFIGPDNRLVSRGWYMVVMFGDKSPS